jgi:SAM-dependent methyltransferase
MTWAQTLRNNLRRFLQAYGTAKAKRSLWDAEYSRKCWDCLASTPDDAVYAFIESAARGGDILDLGCGSGSTANELDGECYAEYTGIDISAVALEMAKKRSEENGRNGKNRFICCDISAYVPEQAFNVILFRDSIYYLPPARVRKVLIRYAGYLQPDGVFIVKLWRDGPRFRYIHRIVERNFVVRAKHTFGDSLATIIIFAPRPRA